jgi:putative endonuclease
MKLYNKVTGKIGEDLAANYLVNKGFEIIKRNYTNKFGELDIVCQKDSVVVFVEVKTKIGEDFGTPEEMVGKNKLRRLRHLAAMYLGEKLKPCRIDVIAVVLNPDHSLSRLTHYENVY